MTCTRILLAVIALAGCKTRNELSCEAPENAALTECSQIDAQETCSATKACTTGVCKLDEGICVPCIDNTNCAGTTPVCNTTNTCEACDAHTDCDSRACNFATGACFAATDVAYVAVGGTATNVDGCTKDNPCGRLNDGIDVGKQIVKAEGTGDLVDMMEVKVDVNVTILGEPTVHVKRSMAGPVVHILGDHTVTIQGLEIREGLGGGGDAISSTGANTVTLDRVLLLSNGGRGINFNTGTLTMRRCIVAANGAGGAVLQDLVFHISNSLFVLNGAGASTIGGLRISGPLSGSSFQYNTVADNDTDGPNAIHSGIDCNLGFAASSNIVTGNAIGTVCTVDHTLFDISTPVVPPGVANRTGDPKFDVIDLAKVRETKFYRIKDNSDAIDHADPAVIEMIDIDGEARPKGTAPDMGADEHS